MTGLQTLVKNVTVVRPDVPGAEDGEALDIGIADGRFARVAPGIPAEDADAVVDGRGLARLPRGRGRPPALGHLQPAGRGHRHREPGLRAGRRDHRRSPTCGPGSTT